MKAKPKNETARFSARVTRGARNGDIVGFATVCLTRDGRAKTTWFSASDQFLTLCGAAASLSSEITHYQLQRLNSRGLPVRKRAKA
jgi:hypothetical protein